jgi:hypothetical protein
MKIKVTHIINDNDGTVKILYDMRIVEDTMDLIHLIHGNITIPAASFAKLKNQIERPEDFVMLLLYTEGVSLVESLPDYLDADILFNIGQEEE